MAAVKELLITRTAEGILADVRFDLYGRGEYST